MTAINGVRRASFYAKTVELQPHELPPPPRAVERVRDALERALVWAPEVGSDVADAIIEAIHRTKGRAA